jgi:hypothetical protein
MTDLVFARANVWMPRAVRRDGRLFLELGAGADANHDPRTFTFPLDETQLAAMRENLRRHLLLWSAILPLCDAAGIAGPLAEAAAVALLDPILLAEPAAIDALFERIRWDRSRLVAHGADVELLEAGHVWSAMHSAAVTADWPRAHQYNAARLRAGVGVTLGLLDAENLKRGTSGD